MRRCSNSSCASSPPGAAFCSPPDWKTRSITSRRCVTRKTRSIGSSAQAASATICSIICPPSASPATCTRSRKAPSASRPSRCCASPRRCRWRNSWNRGSSTFCITRRWWRRRPRAWCWPRPAKACPISACAPRTAPRPGSIRRAPATSPALPAPPMCWPASTTASRSSAPWRTPTCRRTTTRCRRSRISRARAPTASSC